MAFSQSSRWGYSHIVTLPRLFLIILVMTICGCAAQKVVKKPPRMHLGESTTARDIKILDDTVTPVEITQKFSPEDKFAVSVIQLENISGHHRLRWNWFRPDGSLYLASDSLKLEPGKDRYLKETSAWHKMYIKGEQAAQFPGEWQVKVFFDDDLLTQQKFQLVKKEPLPMASVPRIERDYFAVIVGISSYQCQDSDGFGELLYADDDARAMQQVLTQAGWRPERIKTLIDQEATRYNVLIALESWLSQATPNDLILLYWSGHAYPDPANPDKVYFACYDTKLNIPATGYRMDRVRDSLAELNVANIIVMADTCHAGKIITRGGRGLTVAPLIENMIKTEKFPKGWVFMVSADSDRKAIEHSAWKNGAFTHCLLKGISGAADGYSDVDAKDGVVTLGELRAYMTRLMPQETFDVLGVARHPLITTSSSDQNIWKIGLQIR